MKDRDGEIMVKLYYGVFENLTSITKGQSVWETQERGRFIWKEPCPAVWIRPAETGTG